MKRENREMQAYKLIFVDWSDNIISILEILKSKSGTKITVRELKEEKSRK